MENVAQTVGALANSFLLEGKTLCVISRTSCVLFLDCDGEILWVGGPGLPLHRRALRANHLPSWPAEARLVVRNEAISDGTGDTLSLRNYFVWKPEDFGPPNPKLPLLAKALARDFLPHFPAVLDVLTVPWFQKFCQACAEHDDAEIFELALEVIGRGPGLTPLADDFLGGTFFALASLSNPVNLEKLHFLAQGRTTRLSFAILSDLSQGHGPEPLHSLASALFRGSLVEGKNQAQRVLNLGQTTGAGLLLGALTAWSSFPVQERGEEWQT